MKNIVNLQPNVWRRGYYFEILNREWLDYIANSRILFDRSGFRLAEKLGKVGVFYRSGDYQLWCFVDGVKWEPRHRKAWVIDIPT